MKITDSNFTWLHTHTLASSESLVASLCEYVCHPSVILNVRWEMWVPHTAPLPVCVCVRLCMCECTCVCVQVFWRCTDLQQAVQTSLAALCARPSCLFHVSLFTSTFLLATEALTPPSSNCSDACRKLHRMNVAPHFMLSRQLKKQARHLSQTWATPQAQSWPSGDGGPRWPSILPLTVLLMD